MGESFTIKNGAFNSLYLDIPVYYQSKIDQAIEANVASTVRTYPRDQVVHETVNSFLEYNNKFLFNYAASRLEMPEDAKDKTMRTMPTRNILKVFSDSTIFDILTFYVDVTNSFIDANNYKRNTEQAKLALTCFNLLAAYSKHFIDIMNQAITSHTYMNQAFENEHIKILFRIKDAELKNDFYLQWLSVLENSVVTKIGLKVHEELLTFYKEAEIYQNKCMNKTFTDSDTAQMLTATIALLNSAEYLYDYVEANSYAKLLDLCRKISTDIRVLERVLSLPSYATTKPDWFTGFIYIEFVSTEKTSKKKGSLGFNLSVDARIKTLTDTYLPLTMSVMDKQIKLDFDACPGMLVSHIPNLYATLSDICDKCQRTINSLALNISYDRAIYAVLSALSLIRFYIRDESLKWSSCDWEILYKTLQSILCYVEQTEDTIYTTRTTNGLIEEFGAQRVQHFITDLVRDQFALARIKAMLDHADNQKSANYLHNMLYSTLRLTDSAFYQPYIKTYDLINIDDVIGVAGEYDIIENNKDILDQNILALFIADNLFWVDEYLEDLDCDCNVFEAYEKGMQAVYSKYPHMQDFFRTFYSFYIVGVMAYLLKDFNLPLQVLSSSERFNIDVLAKKLRKVIITKKQEEERAIRQAELNKLAQEREAERKRQQELEAQRLAEQKAAEEKERLKQLDLEEANKIMEELNKKAWAGFTVPQQQAAYVRYLQEGNDPLVAANLVKDEFVRRQKEEEALFAQWEQEEQAAALKKQQEEQEAERLKQEAEKRRQEEERKAYKELCDKADKQYEDMRVGRAIFPNVLLSEEEQKTAPLLNIYEVAKLFPEMTTAQKLMKKVYEAPGDALAVDIISTELLRMNEIKANQIIDPIDKEVMSSAKALANKHCVPYDRFTKLIELGMPVEQALIIPSDRLIVLAKMYKADKIVHDRKGRYIVCKGEYIIPVNYKELRELYIKYKKTKGDSDE